MKYIAPDGSREEALLRNLNAGLPMLRARFAAGFKRTRSLPDAIEATPGLAEAIAEAEAEGLRVRAEREKEADGVDAASDSARGPANDHRRGADSVGDRDRQRTGSLGLRGGEAGHCEAAGGGSEDPGAATRDADVKKGSDGRGDPSEPSTPLALTPATSTTPPAAVNEGIRALAARLAAASLETEPTPPLPEEIDDSPDAERWALIREEAAALAPGVLGFVLWVDRRRVDSRTGLYAMDPAWVRHFAGFYDSGEFEDVGRFGVRAAKSDSVCTAITGEVLLIRRLLAGSIVGVCPVMSANMREAGGRFDTVKANLRACGFRDLSGSKADVEPFSFKASGGGSTALKVETFDSQGHTVEFRVYPASEAGAAGFTGIAGFGDELDLWGKDQGSNPAAKVLRVLRSRYTTQPEAKLHLMSATYDRNSEHARLIQAGNCPGQYVARLGKEGAAKDYADRLRLARLIQSADPMLIAPPHAPDCNDIPSWVTNPVAPIEDAYKKAKGDLRLMFSLWGGRLDLAGGSRLTLEDMQFIAEQNRGFARPLDTHRRSADGVFDYGPPDGAEPGRYRGL